jgi:hypothetical protein
MAQYITTVTAKAEQNISCSFKCYKCGKDGIIQIPVEEEITVETYDRHVNVDDFKKSQQEKVNDILEKKLHKIKNMSIMQKCEFIGYRGKCPHCTEFQRWANVGLIPKPLAIKWDVAIYFCIGIVLMIIIAFVGDFYYEKGLLLALPPIITSIMGYIIGIFYKAKYNKKMNMAIKEFQKISENELPTVIVPEL